MYSIGVIGLGTMGSRLAEGFQKNPQIRSVVGYDPAVSHAPIPLLRSLQELIGRPDLDCIYIATPPRTHEELIHAVAQAGKVVFCEKPLAASPEAARACVETVRRFRVPSAVNFPFATAPAAVRLKELVDTGELGDILDAHLTVRFRTWPRGWQHGALTWLAQPEQGGFTREVISHFVFLALRLFGPATIVQRFVERGSSGAEARVRALLQFRTCKLIIDGAVEGDVDDLNRFEVRGSKSTAVMSDWYRLTHESGDIDGGRPDASQIAELLRLLASEPNRLATFDEAAQVVEIIETILAS